MEMIAIKAGTCSQRGLQSNNITKSHFPQCTAELGNTTTRSCSQLFPFDWNCMCSGCLRPKYCMHAYITVYNICASENKFPYNQANMVKLQGDSCIRPFPPTTQPPPPQSQYHSLSHNMQLNHKSSTICSHQLDTACTHTEYCSRVNQTIHTTNNSP